MEASTFTILGLGLFFGLKHATEPDHLAAVGTIVAERKSLWGSTIVGGLWGFGHTVSLFVAGVMVLLLGIEISERTAALLEFIVGVMLVVLGLNVLRKVFRGEKPHFRVVEHGSTVQANPHTHEQEMADKAKAHHGLTFSPRSVIIGMIHGLAGSSAMMLIYLATIESVNLKLVYIVVFGIGSIGGMMLMSFLLGLPFQLTASRSYRHYRIAQQIAGLFSIYFGLLLMYEQGIESGLFF